VDGLVTEFAPTAATLSTPQAYWFGLNGWMTDRLSGPVMEGNVTADEIGAQAWAVYASSYWGALELREHWGMPPAMKRMGMTLPTPPFPDVQQGIVTTGRSRSNFVEMITLAQEADVNRVLLKHGVPVPAVHGDD
jgi:hypothetical protein